MTFIDSLIDQAKQHLNDHPFDASHDLAHHQRVWQNAQDIASHIDRKVNVDILKLATFWHDVTLPEFKLKTAEETARHLKKIMQTKGFEPDFTQDIFLAIKNHEFDRTPRNIEGQILYDADKLDVVHPGRILSLIKAVDDGHMTKEHLDRYIKTGKAWLPQLKNKYHFDYTRTLQDRRVRKLQKDPKTTQISQRLNLNWQTLLRSTL